MTRVAKISVPRAELARLVGVPADAPDEVLLAAVDARLDAIAGEKSANREERERAKDKQLVEAAVADGRLSADSADRWCAILGADREANRVLLGSLTAVPLFVGGRVVDASARVHDSALHDIHSRVMASFGVEAAASASVEPWSRPPPDQDADEEDEEDDDDAEMEALRRLLWRRLAPPRKPPPRNAESTNPNFRPA